MLETAVQLEREPPETETSDSMKLEETSERVKVSVDDSPALRVLLASSSVIAILGRTVSGVGEGEGDGDGVGVVVSTVKVMELLASEPSLLVLPEEPENLDEATEMTPSVVLSAVGVKVAV